MLGCLLNVLECTRVFIKGVQSVLGCLLIVFECARMLIKCVGVC